MDIMDKFMASLGVAVLGLVVIGLYGVLQPHRISHYYLSMAENGGIRVQADIDWQQDDTAFITDDVNKAIDVMNKLNKSLEGDR